MSWGLKSGVDLCHVHQALGWFLSAADFILLHHIRRSFHIQWKISSNHFETVSQSQVMQLRIMWVYTKTYIYENCFGWSNMTILRHTAIKIETRGKVKKKKKHLTCCRYLFKHFLFGKINFNSNIDELMASSSKTKVDCCGPVKKLWTSSTFEVLLRLATSFNPARNNLRLFEDLSTIALFFFNLMFGICMRPWHVLSLYVFC